MSANASVAYIIDFDSTLVTVESLDEFADMVLEAHPDRKKISAELQAITNKGMAGEIPFDVSLSARLKLFHAHRNRIPMFTDWLVLQLSPSAVKCIDWFTSHAEDIFVVSGGFEEFIVPVVQQLGILKTNVYANRFVFGDDGNIIGHDTTRPAAHAGGKATQVQKLNLNRQIIAIGDGYTDLEMRLQGVADEFWAYTETVGREKVTQNADRVLTSFLELT